MLGRRKIGVCKDECRTIPSPGGKGDREAVDEERRHLTICNAVNLNGTDFSNVPFSRSAYKYGTYRRSSSAPVCALGHLPPGGRYCAPASLQTPIYRAAGENRSGYFKTSPKGIPHLISHISYLISSYMRLRRLRGGHLLCETIILHGKIPPHPRKKRGTP